MTKMTRYEKPGSIEIRGMDDVARVADMAHRSGMFQDLQGAAAAGVKIMRGLELGLGPMESLSAIHVVKGRPVMSAQLMAALLVRAGYKLKTSWPKDACCVEVSKGGEVLGESVFSLQDARAAGLSGANWQKYPRNMLFSRAVSNAARWYAPEVLLGVYSPEELGSDLDAPEAIERDRRQVIAPQIVPPELPRVVSIRPRLTYDDETPKDLEDAGVVGSPRSEEWKAANRRIRAIASEQGIKDEDRRALMQHFFQVDSSTELEAGQLAELAGAIEAMPLPHEIKEIDTLLGSALGDYPEVGRGMMLDAREQDWTAAGFLALLKAERRVQDETL